MGVRWAKHIACLGIILIAVGFSGPLTEATRVFMGFSGKVGWRPLGRPGHGWKNNIEMDRYGLDSYDPR
jgi:hypothetical protein